MTCNPHPAIMNAVAMHRHAEFRAEADRFRLANMGQNDIFRRLSWFALLTARTAALALLLATGAAATQDGSPPTQVELEQPKQELAADDSATAVQQMRDAAP
jgi:hypothetical protein